ncbi:hypothetical protein XI06_16475 [Bradyrhizobium sp. CCBAU 11434]|nr:hypothetical protein [Bradyrhizobium sp. CCBAU 11434]
MKSVTLRYDAMRRKIAKPSDALCVGFSFDAGLYRLPKFRTEEIDESCAEHRLSDAGACTGHHNPLLAH